MNARSLVRAGKFDELRCIVVSLRPHIVVVCETWIKNASDLNMIQIPNYTHYSNHRKSRRGGGVSIFVHNDLKHTLIEEHCIDDEIHYLWIHLERQCLDIGAVYNPGRNKVDSFLEAFSMQLQTKKRAIVFGDFNFDLITPDRYTRKYKDTLNENGYRILNKICKKHCTRETEFRKSILDHVCTNLKHNNININIIDTSMSDHKHIYVEIEKFQPAPIKKTMYTMVNYSELYQMVENVLSNTETKKTIDYNALEEIILNCTARSTINKTKLINPPLQDWINKDIIHDINERNTLWYNYKKNKSDKNLEIKFKEVRARVNEIIQKTKKTYYLNYFKNHMKKPKKMWKAINNLSRNKIKDMVGPRKLVVNTNTIVTDEKEICECFNSYFSTIGSVLANAIPNLQATNQHYKAPNISEATNLTNFEPATTDEIRKIIEQLDTNTSCGIDGISTKSVKCIQNLIVTPLTNCINDCLARGVFPDSLKIAKVTPIHKSGDKSDPCNYRPISVLPVISKIFEKVIYTRIEKYLDTRKILYKKQYGFRPRSNTLSASIDLVTKIKNKIDEKQIVLGIFIDLKKAFDTISHKIMLEKLLEIGITGRAHDILSSYFQNRKQIVKIGPHQSTSSLITFGVPQGSILGPLLFLIYINNLQHIGLTADITLYADDTCLFYFGHSIKTLTSKAQNDLNLLNNWFLSNTLTINTTKTNFVIFAAKNKKIHDFDKIYINHEIIKEKSHEKYLGLILDRQLNWKQHIDKIKAKLTSLTGIIRNIAKCLPRKVKYIIYNSLIKPHIDYLIEIWGTAAKSNLEIVQIAQNKLIKSLFHYNFRTPSKKIYEETKIMTIKQTYTYFTCILIYKILNKQIHTSLSFQKKGRIQKMKLRNANNLILRSPRTNYGVKNIEFEGVKMYNKLPVKIKDAQSLVSFKNKLKTYIFEEIQ